MLIIESFVLTPLKSCKSFKNFLFYHIYVVKSKKSEFYRGSLLLPLWLLITFFVWSCNSNTLPANSDEESCYNDFPYIPVNEFISACEFDINDSIWEYMYVESIGELNVTQHHFSKDQFDIKNFHSIDLDKKSCDSLQKSGFFFIDEKNDFTFETLVCLDTMSFVRDYISTVEKNFDGTYGKWHRSKKQILSVFTDSCVQSKGKNRKEKELFENTST